jgi:plasmid maintenance system antidote protein VapI
MNCILTQAFIDWKNRRHLSNGQVGNMLHLSSSLISLIVAGKRRITLDVAQAIYLRVPDDDLKQLAKSILLGGKV